MQIAVPIGSSTLARPTVFRQCNVDFSLIGMSPSISYSPPTLTTARPTSLVSSWIDLQINNKQHLYRRKIAPFLRQVASVVKLIVSFERLSFTLFALLSGSSWLNALNQFVVCCRLHSTVCMSWYIRRAFVKIVAMSQRWEHYVHRTTFIDIRLAACNAHDNGLHEVCTAK